MSIRSATKLKMSGPKSRAQILVSRPSTPVPVSPSRLKVLPYQVSAASAAFCSIPSSPVPTTMAAWNWRVSPGGSSEKGPAEMRKR
ncbi:MAG: hypothetical protein IPI34_01365 [bacterium]|nr:hypothetical protein [bacterium]